MKKQLPFALAAVVFVVIFGLLWSRIRTLEDEVKTLREQVKSDAVIMPLGTAKANPAGEAKHTESPFKLLKAARQNDHTDRATNVGVPWEIERAMIGEGRQNELKQGTQRSGDFPQRIDGPPPVAPPESKPLEKSLERTGKAD